MLGSSIKMSLWQCTFMDSLYSIKLIGSPYGITYRNMYEETEPLDNLSKLTCKRLKT